MTLLFLYTSMLKLLTALMCPAQEHQNTVIDNFTSKLDLMCIDVVSKGFYFFCLHFKSFVIHIAKPVLGAVSRERGHWLGLWMLATIDTWHSRVSVCRVFL